jgi:hypothetical protein
VEVFIDDMTGFSSTLDIFASLLKLATTVSCPLKWKHQKELHGPGKERKLYTSAFLLAGNTVRAADWWNTKLFNLFWGKRRVTV